MAVSEYTKSMMRPLRVVQGVPTVPALVTTRNDDNRPIANFYSSHYVSPKRTHKKTCAERKSGAVKTETCLNNRNARRSKILKCDYHCL